MNELQPYSVKELDFPKYLIGQIVTVNAITKGFKGVKEGNERINNSLSQMSSGMQSLASDFNYGFTSLLSRMEIQEKVHEETLKKLMDIHETLESPTATKAKEFIKKGNQLIQREILDKALESFLKANELDDTDFYTQLQIGKLYLFGIDDDDNVIDIAKARKHLKLAARYAKGELKIVPEVKELASECCFYASVACYVLGNQNFTAKKKGGIEGIL